MFHLETSQNIFGMLCKNGILATLIKKSMVDLEAF
jgi:hypothetical protein